MRQLERGSWGMLEPISQRSHSDGAGRRQGFLSSPGAGQFFQNIHDKVSLRESLRKLEDCGRDLGLEGNKELARPCQTASEGRI